jgi:hypothetical protein
MAFITIPAASIAAGKPTKQELFDLIKDDFDDHESRLTTVENAVATVAPLEFYLNGLYWRYATPQTGVLYQRLQAGINILAIRLIIVIAGTTGTTEVDLQYKVGANPFVSAFTTRPSVAFGAGDYAVSSNGILTGTPLNLAAGTILRLDVTSAQTYADSAIVQIEYEVA